jgi:ketosteroid isomerase-like protein
VSVEVASPLDAYYTALDGGDVVETLATFTENAVYVRPSLDAPGTLEFVRGRAALRMFFERRGKQAYRHRVRSCAVEGLRCFVEGDAGMDGESPTHVFLVSATLDGDGRIARYFALMAEAPDDLDAFGAASGVFQNV